LPRTEKLALALLALAFVAGAVLRLHAIGGDNRLSSDELGYIGDANRLINLSGYNSFHWAPGTPILFAVVAFLSGHSEISAVTHSHGIAQYAQWLVELATMVAAGAFAGRIAGVWAAFIAVIAIATYGPLIELTRTYLSEPLGGLMLIAMVGAAAWARPRDWRWLVAAGVLGGLACLAREDFLPGLVVIVVALALARRGGRRRAVRRAAIYLAAALVTLAPWVAFASVEEHGLVAITTGGTDSLFIGTYLPGDGSQFQTVAAFKAAVCHRLPRECDSPPGDAAPMFQLIAAEHPGDTRSQAITAAVLSNLRKYMLGRPIAFTGCSRARCGACGRRLGAAATARDSVPVARQRRSTWPAWQRPGSACCSRSGSSAGAGRSSCRSIVLVAVIFFNAWFGPEPRDTLRLAPLLFVLGSVGLTVAGARLASGLRARLGNLRANASVARP
jgi:hypothetical protein